MSAAQSQGGEVVVRLLHKAQAMDHAQRLVASGDLQPSDMAVLWFVCTSIDNQTGQAIRKYQTIADACGMSRASVVRALNRLDVAGVIDRKARYAVSHRGQIATAFTLGAHAFVAAAGGSRVNQGVVHQRPTKSPSHLHEIPGGPPANKQVRHEGMRDGPNPSSTDPPSPADEEFEDMAAELMERANANGANYYDLPAAIQEVADWRAAKGDRAIRKAWQRATAYGLKGKSLIDFMEETYPERRRRVAA